MLSVALDISKTAARLEALPGQIRAELSRKVDVLRAELEDRVKSDKLSGQVLKLRTGRLRDSIVSELVEDGDAISALVASSGGVKYAAIQEFGGKTAAHDILPNKAKALSFMAGGARLFAKIVHHPGSTIPERSYMRSALADMKDEIVSGLKAAVLQGLNAS